MWCVGELDEEYIASMEDVLAVYEKPYRTRACGLPGRKAGVSTR